MVKLMLAFWIPTLVPCLFVLFFGFDNANAWLENLPVWIIISGLVVLLGTSAILMASALKGGETVD